MVFVLGIERSATTWLSNILDMHPGTELYMEPLSENISRFSDWPNRFTEIGDLQSKAKYFSEEFEELKKRKRLSLTRIFDADWAWRSDLYIAGRLWELSARMRDFFELNFHRESTTGYPSKEKNPMCVIKEVRLNYNAALIKQLDPTVKVIVILRNFASNIQSISKQFKGENLSELKQLLLEKSGNCNLETLFNYWASSYNTLLKDLDEVNIDYRLIKQEDLILSGKETVDRLFDFLELRPVLATYDYLRASNKRGAGKHNTDRDHRAILEKDRQAEEELYPLFEQAIKNTDWHPLLKDEVMKS